MNIRHPAVIFWMAMPLTLFSQDVAFRIPEIDLIPEGITCDSATGVFYISSVLKNKIVRVEGGKASDFIAPHAQGFFGGVGLHVDNHRRVLWACTGNVMGKDFRTGIFAFDVKSGALIRKFNYPTDTVKRFFNDLVIARNGDVFITDTFGHSVWRYALSKREPQPVFHLGRETYPNGIEITGDNKCLLVATDAGIRRIVIATGASSTVLSAAGVEGSAGLDGMGWFGNSLVAVQNGTREPAKLIQYFFNSDFTAITASMILDEGNPLFDIPTTLVIQGEYAYVIANSQLGNMDQEKLIVKDYSKLRETLILRYKLTD